MVCNKEKATHTIRCDLSNKNQVVIGGANEYKSACAKCWQEWSKNNIKT